MRAFRPGSMRRCTARLAPRACRSVRRVLGAIAVAVVATGAAVVAPDLTGSASAATVVYGPGNDFFRVPEGVTSVTATVQGARGGSQRGIGGGGAVIPATTLAVTPGETLAVDVGAAGGNGEVVRAPGLGGAGFAAGGNGGDGGFFVVSGGGGGGGGGASAIVRGTTPLIVAGGGGGGGGGGRTTFDTLPAGGGGPAGANGGTIPATLTGAGGICCSATTRVGVEGEDGDPLLSASGGGGGGGGGYDGGINGAGLGGATGAAQVLPPAYGGGGGGAGGRSWRQGARYTPTTFNTTGGGQVVITYQASTTTTLTSSLNPSIEGQSVTFTATVASGSGATPTGTVTFFDGGAQIGGPVTLVSRAATFTTSSLAAGSHPITAVYNGDTDFATSTSNTVTQAVNAYAPGLRVAATANPVAVSAAGQTIAYTVTVTNTGNVTINALAATAAPVPPAGPAPTITCAPGTIAPGAVATCTGTYTATAADIAAPSGEIVHTFTASGVDALLGRPVASTNAFSVAVDVRAPQPGWTSILVNTTNTVGLTP